MISEEARDYLRDLMAVYGAAVVASTRTSIAGSKMPQIMRELEREVFLAKRYVKLIAEAEKRGEDLNLIRFHIGYGE